MDSGGFTELSRNGTWTVSPEAYVDEVRRISAEVGNLEWAAPQDWMCEPQILKKTGLSVKEHQRRTVENLLTLRKLAPELPFIPVLQGWTNGDYYDHAQAYRSAGLELAQEPLVGIGSVCRRKATMGPSFMIRSLKDDGLKLHGFGFSVAGLRFTSEDLASSDSMAWSFAARRSRETLGCTDHPGDCRNCMRYAEAWRGEVEARVRVFERGARS